MTRQDARLHSKISNLLVVFRDQVGWKQATRMFAAGVFCSGVAMTGSASAQQLPSFPGPLPPSLPSASDVFPADQPDTPLPGLPAPGLPAPGLSTFPQLGDETFPSADEPIQPLYIPPRKSRPTASARTRLKSNIPRNNKVTREMLASDTSIVHELDPLTIRLKPLDEAQSPPVVTALAADSSGSYLAIAGDDHAVRVYSIALKKVIHIGKSHQDWIHSLAFATPTDPVDGAVPALYSAGDDGVVMCWRQGEPPVALAKFDFAIRSLTLSTERQLLAIAGFSEQIVLWDIKTQRYSNILQCECGDQRTVRFSPDGTRLLCGGRDGHLRVWNTTSGQELAHFPSHTRRIQTASFSSDGSRITSVGEDRRLVQHDLDNLEAEPAAIQLPGKLMSMTLINDSVVAIAGADNTIQLYDFEHRRIIADLSAHEGTVAVLCPFGKMLASGSFDTTVRIWDLERIDAQRTSSQHPVSFAPLEIDNKLRIR